MQVLILLSFHAFVRHRTFLFSPVAMSRDEQQRIEKEREAGSRARRAKCSVVAAQPSTRQSSRVWRPKKQCWRR